MEKEFEALPEAQRLRVEGFGSVGVADRDGNLADLVHGMSSRRGR